MNSVSTPRARTKTTRTFWTVLVGGAAGLFALAVALSVPPNETSTGTGELNQTQPVAIAGDALPMLPETGEDPAVGIKLPDIRGKSFDGGRVTAANDGTPKVILVGAHWCSYCQAEFPKVQQWIDENGLPDNVELLAISTAVDATQPNYSPSAWLERERWSSPVIADDDSGTAARALGVSAFPFFVFADGDGKVESRWAGAMPIDEFASKLARLSEGT